MARSQRVKTADFDYELPPQLIAQQPLPERDASRLMLLDRASGTIAHHRFRELPHLLRAGDLLVLNDTRVIPARLWARKAGSGGLVELLLLEQRATNHWRAFARPARRLRRGSRLTFQRNNLGAEVLAKQEDGSVELLFHGVPDILPLLAEVGDMPLPPYIRRRPRQMRELDTERYQTVFARREGAVAAPTAGLHFTPVTFEALRDRGIETCAVTLHVGPGTFLPVKADNVEEHPMHAERYEVSPAAAEQIRRARRENRRIVAVGTTSVRVLESLPPGLPPGEGSTRLFIHPPYSFRLVGALLTNFHLPRSTLLMLVSALAGREFILRAYAEAVRHQYRFYSYGDCMLIV